MSYIHLVSFELPVSHTRLLFRLRLIIRAEFNIMRVKQVARADRPWKLRK